MTHGGDSGAGSFWIVAEVAAEREGDRCLHRRVNGFQRLEPVLSKNSSARQEPYEQLELASSAV